MLMKNDRKKNSPWLAAGVGALAVFGAYSAVMGVKNAVCGKVKDIMGSMKKDSTDGTECNTYTEGEEASSCE
jgi:hypothetical protein